MRAYTDREKLVILFYKVMGINRSIPYYQIKAVLLSAIVKYRADNLDLIDHKKRALDKAYNRIGDHNCIQRPYIYRIWFALVSVALVVSLGYNVKNFLEPSEFKELIEQNIQLRKELHESQHEYNLITNEEYRKAFKISEVFSDQQDY